MSGFFEQVYQVVGKIPRGKVASYGQIAAMTGKPRAARTVGWALHSLTDERIKNIPWHRVVNIRGEISTTCREHTAQLQAKLLRKENVKVSKTAEGVYKIDMDLYGWMQ